MASRISVLVAGAFVVACCWALPLAGAALGGLTAGALIGVVAGLVTAVVLGIAAALFDRSRRQARVEARR